MVFERFMHTHEGFDVTVAGVQSTVRVIYDLAVSGGSRTRRFWYRYCGSLLARPKGKLDRLVRE